MYVSHSITRQQWIRVNVDQIQGGAPTVLAIARAYDLPVDTSWADGPMFIRRPEQAPITTEVIHCLKAYNGLFENAVNGW